VIEFLCPNGHRIHCPDEQAGRAAKCPKCGVKFRIPAADEVAAHQTPVGSDVAQPQLSDSGAEVAEKEPQIEFLCPNGHRLHGPAALQGRPGQCPECGVKFRIPSYDDVSEEEEMERDISVGRADGSVDSGVGLPQIDTDRSAAAEPIEEITDIEEIPVATPTGESRTGHPMASLFRRLWAEKPQQGSVELHLIGGERLVPTLFAAPLSKQSHGVFAVEEADGTHTLTTVAWDSVVRVVVRGLKKLPGEMAR